MDPELLRLALTNQLRSKDGAQHGIHIWNRTCLPLRVFAVTSSGDRVGFADRTGRPDPVAPGASVPAGELVALEPDLGQYLVCVAEHSGGLAAAFAVPNEDSYVVTTFDFALANAIGPLPQPAADHVVPLDSPMVVVGCGFAPNNNVVVREQYWRRLPESYSLAPGQTRSMSVTIETGMQEMTSELKTVADALSTNAAAGWGPISASVSMSLSVTSTSFQQVTVSSQESTFINHTITNQDATHAASYILWQLTDVVTVLDPSGAPLASIVSGEEPAVVTGPYDLHALDDGLPLDSTGVEWTVPSIVS